MTYEYDVAVSFASEERKYVLEFVHELQDNNVTVFYDEFEEATVWGKDAYEYFTDIYRNKASYCVVFLSESYARKAWPTLELESAQERAYKENKEYILPVRFDDTEIPGIANTVFFLNANTRGPSDLCQSFLRKIGKEGMLLKDHVILRYDSDFVLDQNRFIKSLDKYSNWKSANIEYHLPVSVAFPFVLAKRIKSYRNLIDQLEPGNSIPAETIEQAKTIYSEEYITKYFVTRIQKAVRKLVSYYCSDLLSEQELIQTVQIYSQSKFINYLRNVLYYRLVETKDERWLSNYYHLSGATHESIMSGLPYVCKQLLPGEQLLFWAQIDLDFVSHHILNPTHIRKLLYIPDSLIMKLEHGKELTDFRSDILIYLLPQLIEFQFNHDTQFNIYDFIRYLNNYAISVRAEWFYRIDNYEQIGHYGKDQDQLKADLAEIPAFNEITRGQQFKLLNLLR